MNLPGLPVLPRSRITFLNGFIKGTLWAWIGDIEWKWSEWIFSHAKPVCGISHKGFTEKYIKKKSLCCCIRRWTHFQWFWKILCHSHCGYTVLISHDGANLSEEPWTSYCLTIPRLPFTVENHNHPLLQTIPDELQPQLIHPIKSHDRNIKKEEPQPLLEEASKRTAWKATTYSAF